MQALMEEEVKVEKVVDPVTLAKIVVLTGQARAMADMAEEVSSCAVSRGGCQTCGELRICHLRPEEKKLAEVICGKQLGVPGAESNPGPDGNGAQPGKGSSGSYSR